jgi:hypothetical protein
VCAAPQTAFTTLTSHDIPSDVWNIASRGYPSCSCSVPDPSLPSVLSPQVYKSPSRTKEEWNAPQETCTWPGLSPSKKDMRCGTSGGYEVSGVPSCANRLDPMPYRANGFWQQNMAWYWEVRTHCTVGIWIGNKSYLSCILSATWYTSPSFLQRVRVITVLQLAVMGFSDSLT